MKQRITAWLPWAVSKRAKRFSFMELQDQRDWLQFTWPKPWGPLSSQRAVAARNYRLFKPKVRTTSFPLEFGTDSGHLKPFRSLVKDLTDGRGVDVVYDGVGGAVSEESLRSMTFGGRFVVVGWASTPMVARGSSGPEPNQLPTEFNPYEGDSSSWSPHGHRDTEEPEHPSETLVCHHGAGDVRRGHSIRISSF